MKNEKLDKAGIEDAASFVEINWMKDTRARQKEKDA